MHGQGGGGGGYAAKAVNFNNTTTRIHRALPIVNGGVVTKYLASWWFHNMTDLGGTAHAICCFCTFPNAESEFTGNFDAGGGFGQNIFATLNQGSTTPVLRNGGATASNPAIFPGSGWMNAVVSMDFQAPPNEVYQLYINANPVSFPLLYGGLTSNGALDFGSTIDETDIFFLDDGGGDVLSTGDVADIQVWLGIAPDLSNPTNLSKIISAGKPVNPATAAALFGPQTFLFSGDASTFGLNQGTAGICIIDGAFTNASTSPSD